MYFTAVSGHYNEKLASVLPIFFLWIILMCFDNLWYHEANLFVMPITFLQKILFIWGFREFKLIIFVYYSYFYKETKLTQGKIIC